MGSAWTSRSGGYGVYPPCPQSCAVVVNSIATGLFLGLDLIPCPKAPQDWVAHFAGVFSISVADCVEIPKFFVKFHAFFLEGVSVEQLVERSVCLPYRPPAAIGCFGRVLRVCDYEPYQYLERCHRVFLDSCFESERSSIFPHRCHIPFSVFQQLPEPRRGSHEDFRVEVDPRVHSVPAFFSECLLLYVFAFGFDFRDLLRVRVFAVAVVQSCHVADDFFNSLHIFFSSFGRIPCLHTQHGATGGRRRGVVFRGDPSAERSEGTPTLSPVVKAGKHDKHREKNVKTGKISSGVITGDGSGLRARGPSANRFEKPDQIRFPQTRHKNASSLWARGETVYVEVRETRRGLGELRFAAKWYVFSLGKLLRSNLETESILPCGSVPLPTGRNRSFLDSDEATNFQRWSVGHHRSARLFGGAPDNFARETNGRTWCSLPSRAE